MAQEQFGSDFKAGDRNSSNGTSLQQREASADVFEDGQNRSIDGPIRPMKDGEPYIYGDSRPDNREDGGFVELDPNLEEYVHREENLEAPKGDPEFVPEPPENEGEEILPHYRKGDPEGTEESVLVKKEAL